MQRDSFIFYRSFYEAICCLSDSDKVECFNAISKYALDGEEIEITGAAKAVYLSVKPQIDANNKRYLNGLKGADYGKLGGRPKKDKNPLGVIDKNPLGVKVKTPNVNENENDNENVNVNENENVNVNENDNGNVNEKEEIKKNSKKKNSSLIIYREIKKEYQTSEPMDKTLEQWFGYRDEIKKPLSEKSIRQLIDKVNGLEGQYGFSSVKSCFTESMTNGYQGVFFDKLGKVTPIRDNKKAVDDFFRRELGL